MLLTKTTEYALRVLIFIAKNNDTLNSANHIHEQLDIPYKYLTRILTGLSKKGHLASIKGRDGGFKLLKTPEQVTLADIVDAVEGMERFDSCILGFKECSSEHPCAMHSVWEQNKNSLLDTLHQTTLAHLVKENYSKY